MPKIVTSVARFRNNKLRFTLYKLIIITIFELFFINILSNNIEELSLYILVLYIFKLIIIIYDGHKITSPILFPTVVITFWYVFANYLNIKTGRYGEVEDAYTITFFISISYLFFLFGSTIGAFFITKPIKRILPYIEYTSFIKLLYFFIFVSLLAQIIYDLPIIAALKNGTYFENRINMLFGRGYLAVLGSLQFYFITFLFMIKLYYKKKIILFDYLLVLMSFLVIAITMQRGPLLIFVLMFIFLYNDFKKNIPMKNIIIFSILIVLVFGAIIPYFRGIHRPFIEILTNEVGIHMWNLSYYIDMMKDLDSFGLRPIWMALAIILPGHQDDFVIWIKQYSPINVDIGGASMSLIGEGFLEFGLVGVMLNFLLLGIIINFLYNKRIYSFGLYYLYLYFLIRTNSVLQFGFAKILLTMLILTSLIILIDHVKVRNEK